MDVKNYPGKPGPKPTGIKRTVIFPLLVDPDEYEYLVRAARNRWEKGKASRLIRSKVFTTGWRDRLLQLRKKQGANVK